MKKLLAIALLSLFIVSCNNDDEGAITEQYYSSCFNLVINNQTGAQNVSTSGNYVFKYNYTTGIVDITVNSLYLAEIGSSVSFELNGLSWSYDDSGAKIASASSVVPMLNGQELSGYTVQNVKLSHLDRYMMTGDYVPVISLSMRINGIYDVVVVQTQVMYFGNTDVTTIETGSVYTTTDTYYLVYLNAQNQTASIYVYDARFTSSMVVTDMVFEGIGYTLSTTGYTLECDSLIPTVGGASNSEYEITNLSGEVSYTDGGTLSYDCMATYNVQATLGLF